MNNIRREAAKELFSKLSTLTDKLEYVFTEYDYKYIVLTLVHVLVQSNTG